MTFAAISLETKRKRKKAQLGETWMPHDYQLRGIELMLQKPACGLLYDPGLGKTSIVLKAFQVLQKKDIVRSMLVVAPLNVMASAWPGEISKWEQFRNLKYRILHGKNKDEELKKPADVYLINPDGLPWLVDALKGKKKWPFEMLIVDESTQFKSPSTARFKKFLKPMLGKFKRRYILTGTPIPNTVLDLWSQVYILDCGERLTRYITHYKNRYFYGTGYGGYTYVLRDGAFEEICEDVADITHRLAAEDHLELPPIVLNDVFVDLPPSVMETYKQFEKEFLAYLTTTGTELTADSAAEAAMKCRQIASGAVYTREIFEEARTTNVVHEAKLDACESIVGELNGAPCLVLYEFKSEIELLRKRFGAKTPVLGGSTTAAQARKIISDFQNGKTSVLLAHPQSVAYGLNLQTGHAIVFFSLTWSLDWYLQTIKRLHRQGQTKTVVVHHLLARNTIDEAVLRALRSKDKAQRNLLQYLKQIQKGQ